MKAVLTGLVLAAFFGTGTAFARSSSIFGSEHRYMITNGQGVSSPSFLDGLNGANPAGLIYNTSVKLEAAGATFDNSTNDIKGSGALLAGNSLIAAGAEYSQFNTEPLSSGTDQVNFGVAARLAALNTTLGVSGHAISNGGGTTYDAGTLIDLFPRLTFGAMLKDFTNGIHEAAAGFTFVADSMLDFVVDAAYQIDEKEATVKPGLTLHTDLIQAAVAYGIKVTKNTADDPFLSRDFTAGLGLKLTQNILIEYQYKVFPQHWLGLTLRGN